MQKTLQELKEIFLSQYVLSSNLTKLKYEKDINLFLDVCNIKSIEDLNNFSETDIQLFYKESEEKKWSANTINQRLQIVKIFISYLNKKGYISNTFISDIRRIRTVNKVHYTPSKKDIEKMLNYIKIHTKKNRLYVMTQLLVNTGLRRSEICNLKISDIDFQNNSIKVLGKGKKIIQQPVHKDIINLICSYIKTERADNMQKYISLGGKDLDFVFVSGLEDGTKKNLNNGNRINDLSLYNQIKKYAELSGINNFENITLHSLRRYAGTQVYENTGDIKTASEFLRHSSINTTEQCYINYDKEKLIQATNDLYKTTNNQEFNEQEYNLFIELQKKYGTIKEC